MAPSSIHEPSRDIPVAGEFDLCIIGGSCTGVFAAVRAARLGLSVAIIEQMGCFGGVATSSLVNVWHSPLDEAFDKQIFAGLSVELMDRLKRRDAVKEDTHNPSWAWAFNSAEMQIELDELVLEHRITPWLHTAFAKPHVEDGKLSAVIIENKSGRQAVKARFFIDASGDGDLCHRLGLDSYGAGHRQPSTTCAVFEGWNAMGDLDWQDIIRHHQAEYNLPDGFSWGMHPPRSSLFMLAGTRVYENCSDAHGLTRAEMEGRRQVRAIHDILRKHAPQVPLSLQGLPARIGIRETRHVRCQYQLTGEDVLEGRDFPDAIANGSYRVDIHHDDKPGLTFRYLDGTEIYSRPGFPQEKSRWRPERDQNPTYYQIPYRCLVPSGPFQNLLVAGRFIDADQQAHAAIRVMVNMNQTGEAAGTAAFLALKNNCPASAVHIPTLRSTLEAGGSVIIPVRSA